MNKIRFELGFSEWAEFHKLVKSKLKEGHSRKGIHSTIKDGKIGKDCHVMYMTLFKTDRNYYYPHFPSEGTRFREGKQLAQSHVDSKWWL